MPDDPMAVAKVIEAAPGFFVRQAIDVMAWIDLGGQAVVVDALEEARLENEVFDAIARTLPDSPVRYVLNTHTHYDHVALNEAFVSRCGAQVINQDAAPLGPEGRWFEGPRRRLVMLPFGGCHTREDCLVWSPADRVLCVGDVFGYGLVPLTGALTDESADLLRQAYRAMIAYDPAVVVPGHGPVCGAGELRRWLEYFDWLIEQGRQVVREGLDDEQAAARLAPPEDMRGWWRFVQWKHADSVQKVLSALRRGRLS